MPLSFAIDVVGAWLDGSDVGEAIVKAVVEAVVGAAWNAKHHALWMAFMVAAGVDPNDARMMGLAHEIGAAKAAGAPAFGSVDSRKDIRNNEVGIQIGLLFSKKENGYPVYDGFPSKAIVARVDYMLAHKGCLDGVCLAL